MVLGYDEYEDDEEELILPYL